MLLICLVPGVRSSCRRERERMSGSPTLSVASKSASSSNSVPELHPQTLPALPVEVLAASLGFQY